MNHTSQLWTEEDQAESEPDFYGKWKSIETAPKNREVILLGFAKLIGTIREEDRRVYEGWWNHIQNTWTSTNGFVILSDATHWMPLPDAPKESPCATP